MRTNQKDKAVALVDKYHDDRFLTDMLARLAKNVKKSDVSKTKPIITDASIGASEALFSIASTLRQGVACIDLAHMFISLSLYENPNYDLAKLLLADVLEHREKIPVREL